MYQSRRALSRLERDSRNQGCWSEGVIHHHAENYADAAPVGLGQQAVEIGKRTIAGINRRVICHVVAEIHVRGGIDRGEPESIHAEVGKVAQPRGHTGQVAQAVVIAVRERAHVDLVDDAVAPPAEIVHPCPPPDK